MPTVTLDRLNTTMTWESRRSENFTTTSQLSVAGGADRRHGWVYFPLGRAFERGATIVSARLRLTLSANVAAGSRTLSARRAATTVSFSRMTWATQPAITGATSTVTTTASQAGDVVEFDTAALLQEVSAGGHWWGVRVFNEAGGSIGFASATHPNAAWRPEWVIEWAEEPDAPTDLKPSGGLAVATRTPTLRFAHADFGDDRTITAVRVQVASNAGMTSGVWDSGEVASMVPQLDLSQTAFAGLPADGSIRYWRVMVKDGADWSGWSDVAETRYVALSALAITEPSGSTIMDPTPRIAWQIASQQTAEVAVDGRVVHLESSPTQEVTLRSGVITRQDRDTTIRVRVHDGVARASVPGFPPYAEVVRVVRFDQDAAVPVPTSLTATQLDDGPIVVLSWQAASTPDSWQVTVGGRIVATLDPEETRVGSSQSHRWSSRHLPPRVRSTVQVRAVVSRRRSTPASATITPLVKGVWLTTSAWAVPLEGDDISDITLGESSETHVVGDRSVTITTSQRGYEGQFEGTITSTMPGFWPKPDPKELRTLLMGLRENQSGLRFHADTINVPVRLSRLRISPRGDFDLRYGVSFWIEQASGPELDALAEVG